MLYILENTFNKYITYLCTEANSNSIVIRTVMFDSQCHVGILMGKISFRRKKLNLLLL